MKQAPDDPTPFLKTGQLLLERGNPQEAIGFLRKSLLLGDQSFSGHFFLGKAYIHLSCLKKAEHHFEKAYDLNPEHPENTHLYFSLSGRKLERAEKSYIENLFNGYAEHFEEHLENTLNYRTPALLKDILEKEGPQLYTSVLDLGCGTGLMGKELRDQAHTLIGVDLSSKMLEKALQKGIYDELFEEDLLSYLSQTKTSFDLIVASDTFPYFGALDKVFEHILRVLAPNGILLFSTEKGLDDWSLQKEGRFSHSQKYLEKLSSLSQLSPKIYSLPLRKEKGREIFGLLYKGKRTKL
jgi:predicted TPR repeat methyltransferase